MTKYFDKKRSPVVVRRVNKRYSIIHESGEPVARIRLRADNYPHMRPGSWAMFELGEQEDIHCDGGFESL